MFAKATRAVGEEVKFDSLASCTDLHTMILSFPKNFLCLLRTNEEEKTQLDRRSSLKITVDSNQSCTHAQKTKCLKPPKATGFNPSWALSMLEPLNVTHHDNRT